MSESNNNIPMRITQLEEATAYEDGMVFAVAKAGSGTKKITRETILSGINSSLYTDTRVAENESDWQSGVLLKWPGSTVGIVNTNGGLTMTQRIAISANSSLSVIVPNGYKVRVLFFSVIGAISQGIQYTVVMGDYDDLTTWHTENRVLTVPTGAVSFAVVLADINQNNLTPSDLPSELNISLISIKTLVDNSAENIENINNEISDIYSEIDLYRYAESSSDWISGNLAVSYNTSLVASTTRITIGVATKTTEGDKILIKCPNGYKYRFLFFSTNNPITTGYNNTVIEGDYDDLTIWHSESIRILTVPTGAITFSCSLAHTDDSSIATSDGEDLEIYKYNLEKRLEQLEDIAGEFEIIPAFKGKRLSILGDSISTFAGDNPESAGDGHTIADGTYTYAGNHCRYPNSYLSNVNQTYWKMLIDNLEMNLGVNDSWAGSRVSWNGTESSDQGANIYIASQTRINHLGANGTPDFILVNAGTNDIGANVTVGTFNTENPVNYTDEQIAALPVATFADAYRALLIRLQKKYPLARIIVLLPNYTASYYNPTNADIYLEIIKEACDFFGVPWVDMRTTGITMYNTGTYTGDGIHPNPKGMNYLYEKVDKFFKYIL